MATTRLDPAKARPPTASLGTLGQVARVVWVATSLVGAQLAHAQSQPLDQPAGPPPTQSVRPTLGIKVEHTDNVESVSDSNPAGRRADEILTVTPGVVVRHKGANSTIEGRLGLLVQDHLRGTRTDRVVPEGELRLNTNIANQGLGLDASLLAQQVKPTVSAVGAASASTGNTSTETRLSVSPFLDRPLSDGLIMRARLSGTRQRIDPREDTDRSVRTDSSGGSLSLIKRPARVGYTLEASTFHERIRTNTPVTGSPEVQETGETRRQAIKGTLLYALNNELELGVLIGTERDRRSSRSQQGGLSAERQDRFDGPFAGAQLGWQPGERTRLTARYEDHRFASAWNVEATHRLRRTLFSLSSTQSTERSPLAGAPILPGGSATSVTPAPVINPDGSLAPSPTALADRNVSSNALSVNRTVAGRVTYQGVRSVLGLTAGQFHSRGLLSTTGVNTRDRSRFQSIELSHRLTPTSTGLVGLRWNQSVDATGLKRREVFWNLGLGMRVTARTALNWGISRLASRASGPTPADATFTHVASVRLDHSF